MSFIKYSFKTIESAQVVPGCWGIGIIGGIYSLKPIIIDNVILRGDITGLEVANKPN